jgi:hypothetical protein
LCDTKSHIIFEKINELKNDLSFRIIDKYDEIKTDHDTEKIKAALLKDIELLLYNKRTTPIMIKTNMNCG